MSFHAKLIALGSVFVVLLAALVLGAMISPRAAAQRAETALVFPGLNTDRVQAVELSDAAARLRMTRNTGWSLDAGGKPFPPPPTRWQACSSRLPPSCGGLS